MKKALKKVLALALPLALVLSGCGGGNKPSTSSTDTSKAGKPSTWIADRKIVCRAFIDDLGGALPEDQENNVVAKKIKELTGISVEFEYTAGAHDIDVLTTSIASGDLPDFIVYYLNDSSRPEFPLVLKAAREEMFTDVAPYLKESKVYSKYFEEGFLPNDSKNNVTFRPEFNGEAYIVHMNILRDLPTTIPEDQMIGGMYIQKSITDALKVDPRTIKTQDQLYDLLKKIKAGNFKDSNGKPVYPLGPKFWGGTAESTQYVDANDAFGVSNGFNLKDSYFAGEKCLQPLMDKYLCSLK